MPQPDTKTKPVPTFQDRISADPAVFGGQPPNRGTRIPIFVPLDGLAEGLTPADLIDHSPQLTLEDIQAALAYAAEMTREAT
jgi:uncharacterized protein (DUF433 family)